MGELTIHRPKAASSSSGDLSGFMPARTANYTPSKKTQTLYVTAKLLHRGEEQKTSRGDITEEENTWRLAAAGGS